VTARREGRSSAPKADPKPGTNAGYAEDAPRDRDEAHSPHGRDKPPSPDEGGLSRDRVEDDDQPR